MKSKKTAFILAVVFLYSLSGCKAKPDILPETGANNTTTVLVTEGTTCTFGTTISAGESSGTAQVTTETAFSPLTSTTTGPQTTRTTAADIETTAETKAPTPLVPIIESPFAAIEYVDCSYADNCPKGYQCHMDNASLRYDPVGKRVICTKHFATALVATDRESDVTWPTQRQYFFHGDEFVINLKVDNEYATYLFNIRNNTYKKLPIKFQAMTNDLKRGRYDYTVYDLVAQKEIVLPQSDIAGHRIPSGFYSIFYQKFAVGDCVEKDHSVLVNLETGDVLTIDYALQYFFFDEERYLYTVGFDGIYKLYDTKTGEEVSPNSAKPENPYISDGNGRINMLTGERTAFPNIMDGGEYMSSAVIGNDSYVYQTDGFMYRTDIQTLQQVRFPIPKEIDEVITAAYRDDKIYALSMEVDERTNTLYFLMYLKRPYPDPMGRYL